jgi:hypothetical protein
MEASTPAPPPPPPAEPPAAEPYPVTLGIDYPDRPLSRLTTAFRLIVVIPILIIMMTVAAFANGVLFIPTLLMILFRKKYPRWWWDWNLNLQRFSVRIGAYVALMDDRYPSTDEEQAVHLEYPYPDVATELGRGMPLIKWFLAIPHYVVLFLLGIAAVIAVVIAWFAIIFTGRYPRGLFDYVEGVMRWENRVQGYAFALVTDRYPPFRLAP